VSAPPEIEAWAYFEGSAARLKTDDHDDVLFDRADVRLPGEHLASDLLAAATAARLMGAPVEAIRRAVRSYTGVEHVLEKVAEIGGVAFFNDSKATNVEAARKSLEAFSGPVLPIIGGRYKGGDFADLAPALRAHGKAVLAIGESTPRVAEALAAVVPVVPCASLREAVERGFALAAPGDTVLLAPACSSFDMFEDYAARGRAFKDEVRRLAEAVTRG
jgi:UDP-N-acetylmuramoylalanine--D-glutamate ligase